MAETTDGLNVPIKTTFDGAGTAAADAAFAKTKGSAENVNGAMKTMGATAEALKLQLAGLFAAGAVWEQFKEGFEQVAALEQAMNQLERATKRNGDNFDVVKGKIVGMADALKKAAGVDDDAAIKKMAELYNATGDVANAMSLVALATDVSIGAGMDFERATDLVTRAALGQTRGLKELNISLEESSNKTENANKALEAIQKNFGGAAAGAKGMAVEVNKLGEEWEDFRNGAIEGSGPALVVLMKSLRTAASEVYDVFAIVFSVIESILKGLVFLGASISNVIRGNFADAKDWAKAGVNEFAMMTQKTLDIAAEGAKRIKAIWGEGAGAIPDAEKPKDIITTDGGGEGADGKRGEFFGPSVQLLEDYEEKVRKFEESMIKERAAAWQKYEASKLALKKFGAKEEERIEKDLDAARKAGMDAQTQRILDQVRLEKEAARAKKEAALQYMDAAVGAGRALFGESKAMAYAEAVINTARAITEASPNVWLMAFAAVSGTAQLAKIQSVEPSGGSSTVGKGFDNAQYDAAAVAGGRRWAMDMVGKFGSGASAGWSEGMRGAGRGNTYDNRSTNNYNISVQGFLNPGDQHSMAQFARRLAVVNKTVEGQRRTARTSR